MNVTSASFPSEAVSIIQHIANSRFIAFDFEFSGVAGRNPGGGSGKLNLQEYYGELRSAAQIYQILQVGLTIVTEDTDQARYVVRPYNFNLSPLPALKESTFRRVWSYNSGAISFLLRNGFNLELPLTQGVYYLSRQEEQEVRRKLTAEDEAKTKIPDMILKDEDAVFVDYIKRSVSGWQALSEGNKDNYLNVPSEDVKDPIPSVLNRYQIRLTHQIVRSHFPKLKTQSMGHFVQVTNPTDKQQVNEQDLREQNRERDIANAVGFRWILEAIMGGDISKLPHYYVRAAFAEDEGPKDIDVFLSDLQTRLQAQTRAIVGHNCLTDIVNMYRCFIGDLPEDVNDFRTKVHNLFPIILDTKYLASIGAKRWANTSLKAVEDDLSNEKRPHIHLPTHFDRYVYAANYHEAGFDSFVTAKIGLKLPARLKREGKDIPLLSGLDVSAAEDSTERSRVGESTESKQGVSDSTSIGYGVANAVVAAVASPLTAVKSLLKGDAGVKEDTYILSNEDMGSRGERRHPQNEEGEASPAVKKPVLPSASAFQMEAKKLKSISQNSNIFDILEDDPNEKFEMQDDAVSEEKAKKRIAKMVQKGELLPRWEEDAALWRLIGNKLQANACSEGYLDMVIQ